MTHVTIQDRRSFFRGARRSGFCPAPFVSSLFFSLLFALASCGGSGGSGEGGSTSAIAPRFAYLVNYSSNNVSVYRVEAATGHLKLTATVAAGIQPSSVVTTGTWQ